MQLSGNLSTPREEPKRFAVVYEESVYIPGDERSRACPGHGYPESTKTYQVFKTFGTQEQLLDWVRRNERMKYIAMRIELLEVKTEITLSVMPSAPIPR